MLERFKRSSSDEAPARDTGAVATAERPDDNATGDPRLEDDRTQQHDTAVISEDRGIRRESDADGDVATRPAAHAGNGAATASVLATARERQRAEFGGVNWGASFFGWLVAVGVAALLTSLLAAAGAAIGLTANEAGATSDADEITLGGGIALVVVLMIAYYAGGYVAGRMSRFDGGRQGLGTWALGLIVTVAVAAAAVILGDEYNILERLNLPSLPVGDQTLATGALIALAAIILGTVLAAMLGGKVGERYHRRVDRAGFVD